jgi:hypothetical protein
MMYATLWIGLYLKLELPTVSNAKRVFMHFYIGVSLSVAIMNLQDDHCVTLRA